MTARTDAGLTRGYALLVASGQAFTAFDLSDKSGLSIDTCYRHLRDWMRQKKVVKLPETRGARQLYQAAASELRSIERAELADPYENMWFAMRKSMKGVFCPGDIARLASVGKVSLTAAEASDYCWFLNQAGYLIVTARSTRGMGEHTYRLVKDAGPRAPRPEWRLAAFDPNENRVTYADGVTVL